MKTILIVDDEPMMLGLIEFGLKKHFPAIEVITAENGMAAMERIRKIPVALVITDLEMPEMDGLSLMAAMKDDFEGIPVFVLTGCADSDMTRRAEQGGALACFPKPFDIARLAARVDEALAGK